MSLRALGSWDVLGRVCVEYPKYTLQRPHVLTYKSGPPSYTYVLRLENEPNRVIVMPLTGARIEPASHELKNPKRAFN